MASDALAKAGGRIVVLGSALGLLSSRRKPLGGLADEALFTLVRETAMRLGSRKVRINGMALGAIGATTGSTLLAGDEGFLSHAAVKRRGAVQDVTNAVMFLADPANTYMTGHILTVDGGGPSALRATFEKRNSSGQHVGLNVQVDGSAHLRTHGLPDSPPAIPTSTIGACQIGDIATQRHPEAWTVAWRDRSLHRHIIAIKERTEPVASKHGPEVPIHAIAGRNDRFFPLTFQCRVAEERLRIKIDDCRWAPDRTLQSARRRRSTARLTLTEPCISSDIVLSTSKGASPVLDLSWLRVSRTAFVDEDTDQKRAPCRGNRARNLLVRACRGRGRCERRFLPRRIVHDHFLRRLARRNVGGDPALPHDQHAVAHREHLGQVGGDHHDRHALPREIAEQRVDLGLCADVDAARRLVDDQELRLCRQPLGDDDALLVAAAQEGRLLLDARRLDRELA